MIRVLLLSISVLLIIISYPGGAFPLLVSIAIAPALVAVANLKPFQSAALFGVWALVWWLAALWWGIPALTNFSESSGLASFIIMAGICFTLALPYALSAFIISYFKLWQSSLGLIQIPLCFAVLISLFSTVLPAAPVNALFEYPILLQWADVGGLPLLIFFYFIINASIASIFINKKDGVLTPLVVLFLTVIIVLLYGYYKLAETGEGDSKQLTIGYIQPSLSPDDHLSDLIAQTSQLKQYSESLELIIWPEVPIDFSWQNKEYERYRIRKLAQEVDAHLLIVPGYHYVNNKNSDDGHYNSANLISNEGESLAEYHKQKLVPFFEYLPFKQYLAPYFPNVRNYIAGTEAVPFSFDQHILAPLICYEALFSDMVRPYVEQGASIIVNPGNDGWFGEVGALSHLSLTLIRSIEYRLPLIRVNNSGVSTVINHKGEILFNTLTPLGAKAGKVFTLDVAKNKQTMKGQLLEKSSQTIYYQYGNAINIFAILLLCLFLVHRQRMLTRKKTVCNRYF